MANWKRTLWVLWAGQFCLLAGVSLIAPFLPLYLGELGVKNPESQAIWSGVIFATNYVIAAIFQPVWGSLADKHGRKKMALRSAFGIGLAVGLFAIAPNPWWLLLFRILQGSMVGYSVAANALMSAQAPPDRQGYAMGTLQTGFVAGTVCGPLIGGLLVRLVGSYRPVFLITLVFTWFAGIMTWLLVKEEPRQAAASPAAAKAKTPPQRFLQASPVIIAMVIVIFLANFAAMTVEPTLTLFLESLHVSTGSLELYAGVVFAATGLASFLAAPHLGRLGDQHGHRLVLSWALAGATAVYFLQGLVTAPWQLAVLRFMLGLGVGGIVPAANALIAQTVPAERRGRSFGWNLSANFWGNVAGPLVGSAVATLFHSQRAVFPFTAVIMLLNLLWLLFRVPQRLPSAAGTD